MSRIDCSVAVEQRGDEYQHEPVLVDCVANWLALSEGGVFIDFTVGGGGHLSKIAECSAPNTKLYGFDRDELAVRATRRRLAGLKQALEIFHAPYAECKTVLNKENINQINGALFDLGVSSPQIDMPERGFSFQVDAPLDMRFDRSGSKTASDLLNELSVSELAGIISRYGEERRAGRIARVIGAARENSPIESAGQLKEILRQALGPANLTKTLARVFQALRIAVNDELGQLETTLPVVVEALAPGGRIGVISYHSLEDRIVKKFFRSQSGVCVCPPKIPVCVCGAQAILRELTRKPITAEQSEIDRNPRARSAKFRVAEKIHSSNSAESSR